MERAAKESRLYHLWWHPHNFGLHPERNLAHLRRILDRFRQLRDDYGMESKSMRELGVKETSRLLDF